MGYILDLISLGLLPFYRKADWMGGNALAGTAFSLMISVLVLCLFSSRTARHRWLPFLAGFAVFMVHGTLVSL